MRLLFALFSLVGLFIPRLAAESVPTLRVGDVFDLRVSGVPTEDAQQFAIQFTVGPGGTVNMPLIGEVKAAGLTAPQLERILQDRFVAGRIFNQPTVTINLAPGLRTVSVIGGVKSPGRVTWTVDLTLQTAIAERGDIDEFGDSKGIRLIRDAKVVGVYDLREIAKEPGKDPKLLPGDQIIVRR